MFTGKKDDLDRAVAKSSVFKKVIASMVMAGVLIGASGIQAYAAGKALDDSVRQEHVIKGSSKGIKSLADKVLNEIDEKKDLKDYYMNYQGYSEKDAKWQAEQDMSFNQNQQNRDFIKSLKVNVDPHKAIRNSNSSSKVKVQKNDRERW